jgi:hypothetical protein
MLISEVIHELKIRLFNFFGFVSFIVIAPSIKIAQHHPTKVKKMMVYEIWNQPK